MARQTNSNFFLALICGQVTLWDVRTQDRYALDGIHVRRIIEIWQGDELRDSEVDETIRRSGVFEEDPTLSDWKWDILARIFHRGTRVTLKPGMELPSEDNYEGYLNYCASIVKDMPELLTRRDGHTIDLPAVEAESMPAQNLWATLQRRKTCRDFHASAVDLDCLSQVMYWSFGAIHGGTHQDLAEAGLLQAGYRRAAPSAGSLQATEVYLAAFHVKTLPPGVYHYRSDTHQLTKIQDGACGTHVARLLGAQMFAKDLSFGIFFTSRFDKLWWKYPGSRAYRVALLDVGALLQTFLLVSTALGLETWPTGHFYDDETNKLLGVDGTRETTLFFAGAGHGSGSPFCPSAQRTIARAVKAAAEMAPNTSSET